MVIASIINSFSEWKRSHGLGQPGTYENLHKEARSVSLTPMAFEGGKADLSKTLSPNFQVAHSFSLGAGGGMQPSLYHFGSVFVSGKHLLHGMIDSMGMFQGKYNYSITKDLALKITSHVS
jgi:mitochondrial import receptor subunit TOM40